VCVCVFCFCFEDIVYVYVPLQEVKNLQHGRCYCNNYDHRLCTVINF